MPVIYPNAILIPAHSSRYVVVPDRIVRRIVLHATFGKATRAADTARNVWADPPAPGRAATAAQLVVGRDLAVAQAVPDLRTCAAWHAHAASRDSIGIEVQARPARDDDHGMPVTPAMLAVLVEVVAWLCTTFQLVPGPDTILGHAAADSSTTHDTCPEACYSVAEVVGRVARVVRLQACEGQA